MSTGITAYHPPIALTGFMTSTEVAAVLPALLKHVHLMVGVLASEKTLRGEETRWPLRFPKVEHVADVFLDDPRCINVVHYCADTPPDKKTLRRLRDVAGPRCHGFQFNGAWPEPADLPATGETLILQLPARLAYPRLKRLATYAGRATHVLIDSSGGRGLAVDLELARQAVALVRASCPWVSIGVAGGLCAEELPRVVPFLEEVPCLYMDAEGRLRDGAAGGVLNLERARAWVAQGGDAIQKASATYLTRAMVSMDHHLATLLPRPHG